MDKVWRKVGNHYSQQDAAYAEMKTLTLTRTTDNDRVTDMYRDAAGEERYQVCHDPNPIAPATIYKRVTQW